MTLHVHVHVLHVHVHVLHVHCICILQLYTIAVYNTHNTIHDTTCTCTCITCTLYMYTTAVYYSCIQYTQYNT